ncbi:cell surface protein SprA [Balneolaceae bacterium ANBcel3]|nr:cell surface protein SprA [Balneolaceae bacterium ANBcel3]
MFFVAARSSLVSLVIGAFLLLIPGSLFGFSGDREQEAGVSADTTDIAVEDTLSPYFRKLPLPRSAHIARPFPSRRSPLVELQYPDDVITVRMDSVGSYSAQRTIAGFRSGYTNKMTFEQYAQYSLEDRKQRNWTRLVEEKQRQRDVRRGLLDFTLDLPVGQRSAFTTIFGRPEVNLRVTGAADMTVGAAISETEDPSLPPDQQRRVDPVFRQNLRLNIQGSIGDKLTIQTDWDTERSFDFENRLSIRYEGYEDEILQSVELGNVSMNTGNSLIRGGSSLFGIKAEAQFGPLRLTSVLSQQEGQGSTQTISGGAQERTIEINPASYDNDRHFFIDFYARQEFEEAMSDPTVRTRLFNIVGIDVYVLNSSSREREGQIRAVALADLGVVRQGELYMMPDSEADIFDYDELSRFRDIQESPSASDFGVSSDEFVEGVFEPLVENIDYEFDENTGRLTLDSRLDPNQALAVSFSYVGPAGQTVHVGDRVSGGSERLFLKLLRPSNMTTSSSTWNLTMRNVYSLNATNLSPDDLEVDIVYDGGNSPQTSLPGMNNILLRDLGLDRVNSSGQPNPDNQIDFGTGTLDATRGRIIFPYLEPFGSRIRDIYETSGLNQDQIDELVERYAFTELYTSTQSDARRRSANTLFLISGSSRGMTQDSYNLGFALVEGSVRVTANGVELNPGVDYEVDYSIGNIVITNTRYLQSGQEIVIDYESNQLMQIQQTTFAGLRAEYTVNDDIRLGSTYFTLRERPLQDKIPVGDEPIHNSIIGFDANARFDAPWMTRALNWLPLIQTRADSDIRFSGEFAQLRPGVAQTRAVSRAINRNELYPDEEDGLSFIDDFEGSKTSINFLSPGRWHIAAAPHAIPGYDQDMDFEDNSMDSRIARSDLRGKFSWYMVPTSISRITDAARTPETLPVSVSDVFPNREVRRQEDRLQTLDIHYHPRKRGPYNYNQNLRDLLENRPEDTWGGMTTVLPSGLDNLRQNNIEFLEFWVQPLLPDGRTPSASDIENYDGTIYIDLGRVSEDVIPNNVLNTEDGLARADELNNIRIDGHNRSYINRSAVHLTGQFSIDTQELEDVGLDGAHSTRGPRSEQTLFADWLELMEVQFADQPEMLEQIMEDPSNDRYYYFNDPRMGDRPLHERFHRMYGFLEGNSLSGGESRSITNRPDTEGLINPARVETANDYFQYKIPFNPADSERMRVGNNYIVDMVDGPEPTDRWYLIRLPLREVERQFGQIEDLERIQHMRFWMTGYKEPFTMRFATLELVGNQWREMEELSRGSTNSIFEISTINIEENSNRQPIPYRIPNGAIRSVQRGQQETIMANEQSLSLRVENLISGEYRMVQRLYPNSLNLINYSNMRMFVHGEGYDNREDVEVVIRMGNDLENNYYEYRQPITPTDPLYPFTPLATDPDASVISQESDIIWKPDENSVNLVLSSLNTLKQARDLEDFDVSELYERSDLVEDAPPGAVIAIRGNPSLERVREIGIGIRNPHKPSESNSRVNRTLNSGKQSLDAELWVNELRVSGFDDQKGWAMKMSTDIRMADLATVRAGFEKRTDGFGALDQAMGERQMHDFHQYDINTTMNMHRFLPERYGWNIPVQVTMRRSQRTPRFLPHEGDIRFTDFRDAVEASDLSDQEKDRQIQQMLQDIRTETKRYSLNMTGITKNNSESPVLRYLVDNITVGHVFNITEESSPQHVYRDSWDHTTRFNYRLNIRNVRFIQPLFFLENIPILKYIADTGFSYMPSQFSIESLLTRRYSEDLRRSFTGQQMDPQQRHTFNFESGVSLTYNFTRSITLSFANSNQMNLQFIGQYEKDPADSLNTEYNLHPTFKVLEDWIFDSDISPRRENYRENYSGTWRPRLSRITGLDWFTYSFSYSGGFTWQNSPESSGLGASLSNRYQLNHDPEIRMQNLLRKIPFYDSGLDDFERERRQRRSSSGNEEGRSLGEHLSYYARSILFGALSIQNVSVSYRTGESSGQGGYGGQTSIFHMFGTPGEEDFSPPFDYRTGFSSNIPRDQLISNPDPDGPALSLRATEQNQNQLDIRTSLRPLQNVTVSLNWSTSWEDTETFNQTLIFGDSLLVQRSHTGNISTSIWGFGDGYGEIFNLQLERLFGAIDGREVTEIDDVLESEAPLSANSLEADFREAYMSVSTSGIGQRGYLPFPLPNWQLNWTGLEQYIPFDQSVVQRISLNHSYRGQYRLGWELNTNRGEQTTRPIGPYRFMYEQPEYHGRSLTFSRDFSPFLGLQITWLNDITTRINYNIRKSVNLGFTNNTIVETNTVGVSGTVDYSKRGFRIPFFRQLNNQIDFRMNFSYSEELRYTYRLNEDLVDALRYSPEERESITPARPDEQGYATLQIRPSVTYQFSRTITAGFQYGYTKMMPRSSGNIPRVDQDIMFNIQVRIRSN